MTNNEIMQSSLLDILFDNRNKEYGAYALRRGYHLRLFMAVIIMLFLAALLMVLNIIHIKKQPALVSTPAKKDSVVIRIIEIPWEKPREPEQPEWAKIPERTKEKMHSIPSTAQLKFTSKITMKEKVKVNEMPMQDEIKNKLISGQNIKGPEDNTIVKTTGDINATGDSEEKMQEGVSQFIPDERPPEFPGGKEALMRFLKNNLVIPDELQAGDKKTVEIRFKVDADGQVADLQIIKSSGVLFDREVLRVCKKMPRWKPAVQNGGNIAVFYLLPVTFIGIEQ
jgi:protein TonB